MSGLFMSFDEWRRENRDLEEQIAAQIDAEDAFCVCCDWTRASPGAVSREVECALRQEYCQRLERDYRLALSAFLQPQETAHMTGV